MKSNDFFCRSGNTPQTHEISIDERRIILLEILKYIDNQCEKNGITYYIAYGSLLGTVRHKGFIPWDDDIDIWVPICDYKKLLSVIERDNKYDVLNNIKDKDYYLNFAKISDKRTLLIDKKASNFTYTNSTQRGIAIDIFPLFDVDNNKIEKIEKLVKQRSRYFKFEHEYYHGIRKLILGFGELIGRNEKKYREEILLTENVQSDSGTIGCSVSPYGRKEIFRQEWFSSTIKCEFENMKVSVPCGYDSILTTLYGDYMSLPPEEKRKVLAHNVKAVYIK